jgi:superfamily II DNA or RNA helicase
VNVTIPPFYRIALREGSGIIRQISVPSWAGEANLELLSGRRGRGFVLRPVEEHDTVLVLTNASQPDSAYSSVLRQRDAVLETTSLDLSASRWIRHPLQQEPWSNLADYETHLASIRSSWKNAFNYKRENIAAQIEGLRPPQIGAVYAVQSHWTVNKDAATVVLPTGVGKTETMLSVLVAESCERLLVVVPTDALRTQIFDKFLTFGLLKSKRFGVIAETAEYPVVGKLLHAPADLASLDEFTRKCNVIVTTMALAVGLNHNLKSRLTELCSTLFIDEAHHVGAPRWKEFRDAFERSRIVQFTATPFRNDDKPIGGRRIFNYSLKQAQDEGYFKQIVFKPVMEFDPDKKDLAVAEAAVQQLREDLDKGHILMARVADTARAEIVFKCYQGFAEFNPVQLHTGIKSRTEREEARRKLLSGESRIVVCVEMLGEGFDLPELKIAAFHDIRKSLAVTLQLAGRFTRSKPQLGNATFIANIADVEVKNELRRLYQHDSDWNSLLPLFSEQATTSDFNLWEFLRGFQQLPEGITLQNVRPAMSTVVYRTNTRDWTPENFEDGIAGFKSLDKVYHSINPHEKTLVIVTTRRVPVEWAQIDEIHNWDWQLYVLHWDQDKNLLYIHNSSNAGFFKRLAGAVAGDVQQIRGPEIFRCLAGINRLKLQNVGLLEQLGRLIRYTMRAGSDVESGMTETQKRKAIKSNLFGQGFEGGGRTTIGCSYKGRIWSYKTTNLLDLTRWSRSVGAKLNDSKLDPEEVLNGTLVPVSVSRRPEKIPIAVEWPDLFYKEPESVFAFHIDGQTLYPHTVNLEIIDPSESGPLRFAIVGDAISAEFEMVFSELDAAPDFLVRLCTGTSAVLVHRSTSMPLTEFFGLEPPTFWFANGASLSGIDYVELRRQPEPFARDRIESWDWTGTNIRSESQGIDRDTASIQYRVISEIKKRSLTLLVDDDDQGESADVVSVTEHPAHIEVEFWHCKFANEDSPGARIKELYEVCGQAQKSIRWLEKPRDLFSHLLRREPRRFKGRTGTRYEIGSEKDLIRIREKAESQRVLLKIAIVQPGLSMAKASSAQLELLAVTENYLMETFAVPFTVVGSP